MYELLLKSLKIEDERKVYIIKDSTMMIIPIYTSNGELHSIIIELFRIIKVQMSPKAIVQASCIFYGSDMDGAINSASDILKDQRMLPIIISQINKICIIPISSPYKPACMWVVYKHIVDTTQNKNRTILTFIDGRNFELNVSRAAMRERIHKAGHLISSYDMRNEQIKEIYKIDRIAEEKVIYLPDVDE